ncbi:MAG: sulfatase-like hydrolase/transferase [Verrucomicrobiota bacterium]
MICFLFFRPEGVRSSDQPCFVRASRNTVHLDPCVVRVPPAANQKNHGCASRSRIYTDRHGWVLRTVFALSFLALSGFGQSTDQPNVLFIAIDDLRPELGCYGSRDAISPHIDRLAAEGVRFDSAHCQIAVCNPSRVSVLTGLRPDTSKVWTLDVRFRETVPDALTLPRHFRNHGYETRGFGKVFHNPWPDNDSWSEPHSWPKAELWSEEAKAELSAFQGGLRKKGVEASKVDRLRATATEALLIDDSDHIDGAITKQALAAMRELGEQEKPFFLAAGFIRPHLPFVLPKKYWDLYNRDKISLAGETTLPENAPRFAMNTAYELRDYFDYLDAPDPLAGTLTESQQRKLKHGYLASVSFIDAQVGLLLEELDRLGLAENTIVVLWSDHGFKLGEHNSWCKQTNYEIDTRVPLLIRAPNARGNGSSHGTPVELLDIFPTLCDLAGLPVPAAVEGVTLRQALEKPSRIVKKAAVSQFLRRHENREVMGYAIRDNRWRYVEWIDLEKKVTIAQELYDHRTDPRERISLAQEAEHEQTLNQLGIELRTILGRKLGAVPAEERPKQRAARNSGASKSQPGQRPRLTFKNKSKAEVTVFWIPPSNREPKRTGAIAPGKSRSVQTTLGHRFRILGGGIDRIITVSLANEVISITTPTTAKAPSDAPNIVVIMADDWSWPHASILGNPTVRTPNFDRIAKEGVLFENAFTPVPSCTPSRHVTATGQAPWRLGQGINLGSSLQKDIPVYPDRLRAAGYLTGYSRKGTGPSKHLHRGNDPFGKRFDQFSSFLEERKEGQPFAYFYGAGEPHRPFSWQASLTSNLELDSIRVPPFLPDNETTQTDLGDYFLKVEQLDRFAGEILNALEEAGELEDTIVVMTSDNGMAFPRAKATLYDAGCRIPLAIRWGERIPGGRRIEDFVTLADLAPSFLEAAELAVPDTMVGQSLLPTLLSDEEGSTLASRDHVVLGMEQHVYPNPSRAIRTKDYLYIRNFAPEAWPTGKVGKSPQKFDFKATPWPTVPGAFSHNIDPGPTKQWMRLHDSSVNSLSFGKRPAEELYDLRSDPDQITNLLAERNTPEETASIRRELSNRLTNELRAQGDPRFAEPDHATFSMNGWKLHLSDRLWAKEADAARRMLELLHGQLQRVVLAVPEPALSQLREIPIWINPPYPDARGTAEYHPARGWLENNRRNPKMARAVEITNVLEFPFENRRMPYLLLHELAHGYHDRYLPDGYQNEEIREAFVRAEASGSYNEVDRFDGNRIRKDRAYALSNPMEYFAESSEAFFGKNDFFPFNREELKEHDPYMHRILPNLWQMGPHPTPDP